MLVDFGRHLLKYDRVSERFEKIPEGYGRCDTVATFDVLLAEGDEKKRIGSRKQQTKDLRGPSVFVEAWGFGVELLSLLHQT